MIPLMLLGLLAAPPKFDRERLPYSARWGQYIVYVDKERQACSLVPRGKQDGRMDLSLEMHLGADTQIENVRFIAITTHKLPVLYVLTHASAGHSDYTEYLYLQHKGRVSNVLVFDANNYGIAGYADLDRDGRKEILAQSDVLAYWGMSYASSPAILMVLGWNGKHYVDRTQHYAWRVLKEANRYRRLWLAQPRKMKERYDDQAAGYLAGYYGNLGILGKSREASQWLQHHLPASYLYWFRANVEVWQKRIPLSFDKISVLKDHQR